MSDKKKDAVRRRLLGALPRADLEEISGMQAPWHSNRSDIISHIISMWPTVHDDVADALEKLTERAK